MGVVQNANDSSPVFRPRPPQHDPLQLYAGFVLDNEMELDLHCPSLYIHPFSILTWIERERVMTVDSSDSPGLSEGFN